MLIRQVAVTIDVLQDLQSENGSSPPGSRDYFQELRVSSVPGAETLKSPNSAERGINNANSLHDGRPTTQLDNSVI